MAPPLPPPDPWDGFVAFILTHGRPNNVITYAALRSGGYTGRIVLLVDDLDPRREEYIAKYGAEVEVFDKRAVARTFDQGDNFEDMRAVVYARNACFEVAKQMGIRYFVQLDDDYLHFQHRFDERLAYRPKVVKNLDAVFRAFLRFYIRSGAAAVAMSQGGDFIGGPESSLAEQVQLRRKCMNAFFCSTDRPFRFLGRVNEDVNTYTRGASTGALFLTTNQVSLEQVQTQANEGGMTELYLDSGTYVKSFYSVMFQPSSVRVAMLRDRSQRLHHRVSWRYTVPQIVSEGLRKA